jgi:plasmid stabilization system protein ParE
MASRVIFSSQAEADVDAIVAYIARDNPEAAYRFGRELFVRAQTLAGSPFMGVALRRKTGIRYFVHRDYQIFYRVNEDTMIVEVLRFWHGARNPRRLSL